MKIFGIHHGPFSKPVCVLAIAASMSQALFAQTNGPETFTKKNMLCDIAGRVITPRYAELAAKCQELTNSISILVQTPSEETMANARRAWVDTLLAVSRIRCYQAGPMADRNASPIFFYWQVLPPRIEELLNSSRAIDTPLLDDLGATTKGLFALEYLLYTPQKNPAQAGEKPATPLELLSGSNGKRRCALMLLLSQDIDAKASLLAKDWSAAEKSAATKFNEGGQESVNLVVNQLAKMVEDATEHRLRLALVLREPLQPQLYRIEGSRSGTSLQSLVASLEGARELFRGGEGLGLDDALKRVNPALEKRVEQQFEAAIAAAKAVNVPIEQAVFSNRAALQSAMERTRALEVLLKVDVVSALGVTLTFSSVDGD